MAMTSEAVLAHPIRLVTGLVAALGLLVGVLVLPASPVLTSGASAATTLSISEVGNHFVNGDGQTVRLLGVDVPGTEYACEEGWGYSQVTGGNTDPATIASLEASTASSIAAWHANAVRVPLNEDCWLGINGQPSFDMAAGAAGYRKFIEDWVQSLNAAGLYVILDLHWSAPGTNVADGQRPMPDDHSAAFWTSVASTFAGNHAVVFDAFNEPYSPQLNGNSSLVVNWSCWRDGGCQVPVAANGMPPDDTDTYTAVGMQSLVDAIRTTGATQPIMVGGLDYANDLSGWLANQPSDPDHEIAASFHNYYSAQFHDTTCDQLSCWSTTIASVAASVPVVTGEFDQGFDCQSPPTAPSDWVSFDDDYMTWADANGVSYLAWGWWELSPDPTEQTCQGRGPAADTTYGLIDADGQPVDPDGTSLHHHLATLAPTTPPPTTPPGPTAPTAPPTTAPPTTTSPAAPPTTAPPAPAPPVTSAPPSPAPTTPAQPLRPTPGSAGGYELVGADGGVFTFGQVPFEGSLPGLIPPVRVTDIDGIVPSADDRGYSLVGADGGVFDFGDANFEGSLPGLGVHVDDIAAIAPTSDHRGYQLVGRDGGVFSFGDARFLGSLPGLGIHVDDVVGIAAAAGGTGYWVAEADGVVHAFGTAQSFGNVPASGSPIAAIAATPDGRGYWAVTAAGAVFSFGDAPFLGSLSTFGVTPSSPVVSLVPTRGGNGYWVVSRDGALFAFGDAASQGSLRARGVHVNDIVGAAPVG